MAGGSGHEKAGRHSPINPLMAASINPKTLPTTVGTNPAYTLPHKFTNESAMPVKVARKPNLLYQSMLSW
jgi:hypothetical protein